MQQEKKIKIYQVFENYPLLYQAYIPPLIEKLSIQKHLQISLQVFNEGVGALVEKLPSYYRRRLYTKWCYLINHKLKKLNYLEIKALRNQVDIVHLMDSFLHPKVYGLINLPENKRPKLVVTLRGGDTYIKPWMQKKWQEFYIDYGKEVDAFIVMSQNQKDYLCDKWGIAEDRIYVIPISLMSTEVFTPKTLRNGVIKIVSAFRMCWEKNIAGNLLVIKQLVAKGISVQYDLYGDGPDVGQVYYLIEHYGLRDVVNYHGKVSNDHLQSVLKHSDFYLQLSFSESLSMSVLEAQAQGIPAIVSNVGGLPEAIVPGVSGFCVPPYDALQAAEFILELYESPETYKTFSKAGIAHVQTHFSINHEVEQLVSLYQSLVNIK